MTRSTKIEILVCALILGVPACVWLVSEFRWAKLNSPDGRFATLEEYIAYGRLPDRVTKVERDGRTFFIAYSPMDCGLAIPSGPAAYVFDDTGTMVEWSGDTGEDPGFWEKWPRSQQKASSIEELEQSR